MVKMIGPHLPGYAWDMVEGGLPAPATLPDEQLFREAAVVRRRVIDAQGVPHGACHNASFALGLRLARRGQRAVLVLGDFRMKVIVGYQSKSHWWLELPDGRILDATADQFGSQAEPLPEIILGARKEWPQYRAKEFCLLQFGAILQYYGVAAVREGG